MMRRTSRLTPTRDRGPASPPPGARVRPRAARLALVAAVAMVVSACGPSLDPSGPTGPHRAEERDAVEAPDPTPEQPPARGDAEPSDADRVPAVEDVVADTSSARLADLAASERVPPTGLRVPSIGLDAPVVPTGARGGAFDVIDGVEELGWYRYGPAPGEPGSAVLAAHVDTAREGPGLFFELDQLRPGDTFEVVLADGTTVPFEVTSIERYRKEELPVDDLFARDGEAQVALITCGGAFDPELRRYEDNVVAIATPLP